MKKALGMSLAATALALGISTTAFAQSKGVSESKGGQHKGGGYEEDVRTVAEPGTLALLGAGVVGLAFFARRRKK